MVTDMVVVEAKCHVAFFYCNPFGRPASPKRRMRDPGEGRVNDIQVALWASSSGRLRLFLHLFVSCFVRSFDRSCVRSFVPLFVRLFVRPVVCSFVRSCVRSFDRSFDLSFVCSFVR